jgi:hypothetical protein
MRGDPKTQKRISDACDGVGLGTMSSGPSSNISFSAR